MIDALAVFRARVDRPASHGDAYWTIDSDKAEFFHAAWKCYHRVSRQQFVDIRRYLPKIDATLTVVGDEIQKLNLELQMLRMRKKALQRRTRVLRKIADSLQSGGNNLMAA